MSATTHNVALSFEDGVTRFVSCRESHTVADASYASRINIPVDCTDGACGTCKSYLESGECEMSDYISDALAPDEEAAGYVLTCSMCPRSDLVLQIPTTSAVAKTSAGEFAATVAAVERLSPTTMSLTLDCDDRDKLVFLPGQYVNIAVPGSDQTRSYSFASAPDDKQLTFLVKLSPGGVMSDWLENWASAGDAVGFTGPHGSFFLRESDTPLLLLAGGTGLAPILSILRRLEASGACGVVKAKLRLSQRTFTCESRGLSMDRDDNPACNLAALVGETVAGGGSSQSCGASVNEPDGTPRRNSSLTGSGDRHGKPEGQAA